MSDMSGIYGGKESWIKKNLELILFGSPLLTELILCEGGWFSFFGRFRSNQVTATKLVKSAHCFF